MEANTHIHVLYVVIKVGYINKINYGKLNRQRCFSSGDRDKAWQNARNKLNLAAAFEDNYLLSFLDTLEVKEINSTDAFIKKACAYLDSIGHRYIIDAFRKHMEKE